MAVTNAVTDFFTSATSKVVEEWPGWVPLAVVVNLAMPRIHLPQSVALWGYEHNLEEIVYTLVVFAATFAAYWLGDKLDDQVYKTGRGRPDRFTVEKLNTWRKRLWWRGR